MALIPLDADDCATQMARVQRDRIKRGRITVVVLMGVAVTLFGITRRSASPPVSEEQASAEANQIAQRLPALDGYPFDARYSEGARVEATRLAELTKDAYDYFAAAFPGARPQIIATFLKPADWDRRPVSHHGAAAR